MQFWVCLRDLNKISPLDKVSPLDPIAVVMKQNSWEDVGDYVANSPEREALREFTKRVQEMESIPDNVDVYILWFAVEGDRRFDFPEEFLQLVSERGLKVTFDLTF